MLVVQCDFDDTITVGNVSAAIRQAFAPDAWRGMEEEHLAGRYSVEESNIRQFALVGAAREEIEEFVLSNVLVREGFQEFAGYCAANGVRLVVVSSGLDLYIGPTMRRIGLDHLEVHSATAEVTESGIRVEYFDPSGANATRGFKDSYLRHFRSQGDTVIYIGDGLSDIAPAGEADYVIARSTLARHCKASGIDYYCFEVFDDVAKRVDEIRQRTRA